MSPVRTRRSLLAFAAFFSPAFVLANPLAAPRFHTEGLSRRGNGAKIPCGNAPNIIAGNPVTAADIVVPNPDESPPQATTDPSGYFPYLWCGAGTSTYVFIDPIGSYGYNKGTDSPIFWTGLDGAYNGTQNAMETRAATGIDPPTGDGFIDGPDKTSITDITFVGSNPGVENGVVNIAGNSGINYVQVFVQNANHQKLTYGVYAAALTIMKDFALTYPLYADTSYFQINDGKWGTLGNGYVGVIFQDTTKSPCYVKGNPAQNTGVLCGMPSKYPDN